MSRRILVTGSAGFIGSAVQRVLEQRGDTCVPFDHPHDVRDRSDVADHVRFVDGVIHLAGILGTSETFGSEHRVAEVNVLGALNVADACLAHDVPMVQIGTGHYGHPNPYAITKAAAQDLLLGRRQPIAVVQAFHAYGPGQRVCPPHGKATVRKIIPSFVCRALTQMPIEIFGSGEQLVDMIHVDEVARILVEALDGPYGVVTEAGTGLGLTVRRVAEEVIAMCDSSSELVHLPARPGEPEGLPPVVARNPASPLAWPYGMGETIDWYVDYLEEPS